MTKFKLDEHFGIRIKQLFLDQGLDVHTVRDERLQGTPDANLFEICREESRCLITLDLDFSDVLRFPPYDSLGIVVLRPRKNINFAELKTLTLQLIRYLKMQSVHNQLWIVEKDKIRIHQPKDI